MENRFFMINMHLWEGLNVCCNDYPRQLLSFGRADTAIKTYVYACNNCGVIADACIGPKGQNVDNFCHFWFRKIDITEKFLSLSLYQTLLNCLCVQCTRIKITLPFFWLSNCYFFFIDKTFFQDFKT